MQENTDIKNNRELKDSGETKKSEPLVFLIEDDPSFSKIVSSFLFKNDYKIISFSTAKDVKESLNQNIIPDLFICDLNLPDETGISLIEYLKMIDAVKNTPIVILTSEENIEIKINSINLG